MRPLRFILLLLLCGAAVLTARPVSARADDPAPGISTCTSTTGGADGSDTGTIGFTQPSFTADEYAGQYWITITRSDTSTWAQVSYGVNVGTAQAPGDFTRVPATVAYFAPGQASCQFPVAIVNNHLNGPSISASVYLDTPVGATLPSSPDREKLTILRNDPRQTRDRMNPLDLPTTPTDGDPLSGAQFYVAPVDETAAGKAAAKSGPAAAKALTFIAQQPSADRFEFNNTQRNIALDVSDYLEVAQKQQPGTVVELSTYSLVQGALGSTANPAFTQRYLNWVRGYAKGIGNARVVMLWEPDSLLQASRLTPTERHIRLVDQLKPAIQIFEQTDPHLVLYLDAGSSDGMKATRAAAYLRQAGIDNAQGFFLNSTHFMWDTTEIQQGQKISKLLGGTHFLISSGVNGRGPLMLREQAGTHGPQRDHVAEQLCNPVGRGLGTESTQTGYAGLDGLLWFAPVGNSAGACRAGAPPSPDYWPAYAVSLYQHRRFGVTGPRLALKRSGTYEPYSAAFGG